MPSPLSLATINSGGSPSDATTTAHFHCCDVKPCSGAVLAARLARPIQGRFTLKKWTFETGGGGWGNQELEVYAKDNASTSDAGLIIEARKDPSTETITSARMKTQGHAFWKYGRFEARMKLPTAGGMWPAFWMMPEDSLYVLGPGPARSTSSRSSAHTRRGLMRRCIRWMPRATT
jgi:hypothetical protein